MRRPVFLLCALLLLAAGRAPAAVPDDVRKVIADLEQQRDPAPVFEESFTGELRQWGDSLVPGPDGILLDRAQGTFAGARQIYVPGLLMRDGAISCELRLSPNDQGYLVFRCDEEDDNAYQLLITSRDDGSYVTGFVKKHALDQLYGGQQVGESYRAAYPAGQWLSVRLYMRDRTLAAAIDGEPAAYYDRADARDGSISLLAGSRGLGVRNLSVSVFQGGRPTSPYRLPRSRTPLPCRPAAPFGISTYFPEIPCTPGGPPRVRADGVEGSLHAPDGEHVWHLDDDGRFFYDGQEMIPLRDTNGLYFALVPGGVDEQRAIESICDQDVLNRIRLYGLPFPPVRVCLADYVNALGTDHDYGEEPVLGGRTRIFEANGRRYRATSCRRWLSYFAYTLHTDLPLQPHLVLAEAPNDRERNLCVRVQPPDGSGGDPDYGVGAGTFTGRGVPTNGRPFNQALLFTPRTNDVRLTISRMPAEENRDPNNGAAVDQIFLFTLIDSLSDVPNPVLSPPAAERTLSLAVPSARALLRQCGAWLETPGATREQRSAGYRAFLHLLRFLGFNGLDLGMVDVEGRGAVAQYAGSHALPQEFDYGVFSDLLPLAEQTGIRVTPVVPPLPASPDAGRLCLFGRDDGICRAGGFPILDLLQPGGQDLLSGVLDEIADRCRNSKAVRDLALEVDGNVGGCIPRAGSLRAEEVGYGAADLTRFAQETGIRVPAGSGQEAYEWLRANAWERWIDWRCQALFSDWLRCRSRLQAARPDWRLVLKLAVPDREFARTEAWFREHALVSDLMRANGFDPRLFRDTQGVVLQPAMEVGYDRVCNIRRREHGSELDAYSSQPGLLARFRSAEETAVTLSLAPWEEYGARPGSEFYPRKGGSWGASTMTPWGRWLFRPLTRALREYNPARISVSDAEFATAGREGDWRAFARAYRALPAVEPAPLEGEAHLSPLPRPAVLPDLPGDLLVRQYGDRIGILNDSDQPHRVELRPLRSLQPGERWVDLATGCTLARGEAPAPAGPDIALKPARRTPPASTLIVEMDAYDLHTLAVMPDGQ